MRSLLALLLLIGAASSVLENSFCDSVLHNVNLPGPNPGLGYSYWLSSICLTFDTPTNFTLSLSGTVKYTSLGYLVTAFCKGNYYWAAPDLVVMAYESEAPSYCSQSISSPGFCPWVCPQFGGSFVPYFDEIAAPTEMTLNNPSSSVNWGSLPQSITLVCNTTSCGSAANLVPNLQQNASYTNGTFTDLYVSNMEAGNETVDCWLSVGNPNPANTGCGDVTLSRLSVNSNAVFGSGTTYPNSLTVPAEYANVVGSSTATDSIHTLSLSLYYVNAPSASTASYEAQITRIVVNTTASLSAALVAVLGSIELSTNVTGGTFIAAQFLNIPTPSIPTSGSSANFFGLEAYGFRMQSQGMFSGSITGATGAFIRALDLTGVNNIVTATTVIGADIYSVTRGTSTSSVISTAISARIPGIPLPLSTTNVGLQIGLFSGGTNNAALQLTDTTGVTGGGIAWGNFEFSEYRCAASTKCNTGNQRVSGYLSAGSASAPLGTTAGDVNGIRWISPSTADFNIYAGITSAIGFKVAYVASAVNYMQFTPSVTGVGVQFIAAGGDTNIPLFIASKGTGAIHINHGDNGGLDFSYNGLGNTALNLLTGTLTGTPVVLEGRTNAAGSTPNPIRISGSDMIISTGSVLATNAAAGFVWMPYSSGTPTGTPGNYPGARACEWDDTNFKWCCYTGGAWKCSAAFTAIEEESMEWRMESMIRAHAADVAYFNQRISLLEEKIISLKSRISAV